MATIEQLVQAVTEGDTANIKKITEAVVAGGGDPAEALQQLTDTMKTVGEKFSCFEIFLPEMIMTAEAMMIAVKVLAPLLAASGQAEKKAKIVIGSPAGDMHEIGKRVVATVLNAYGFEVVDLGANVDLLEFVNKAKALRADVIAISSLMTTTMTNTGEIIGILKEKGWRDNFKVIVGGAPTSPAWAREIGADGWAENASQVPDLLNRLLA